MTIVYRIEDKEGQGPYQGPEEICAFLPCDADIDHPAPADEGIPRPPEEWEARFAFPTRQAVRAWFSVRARRWLDAQGFKLVEYRAPEVSVGRRQAVFNHNGAEHVAILPLLSKAERGQ